MNIRLQIISEEVILGLIGLLTELYTEELLNS